MMGNKVWHCSASLAWLQRILYERYGHIFELLASPDNSFLTVSLIGDVRSVTLALDGTMFARADSNLPCLQWDPKVEGWSPALTGCLPMPGATSLLTPLIIPTKTGWHIGYDILGLTYWMLTRQEEIGRDDLDVHGRFPATASHAYIHNYLERPIVDEWLHILGMVILKTWPGLELKLHQFTMKVSHDVDAPSRYGFTTAKGLLRAMIGDLLKRGEFINPIQAPWVRLNTKKNLHSSDPFNTFEWIMDLSDRHGLTSAFYFICGRTSNLDADYELEHPAVRALLRRIHERGHEIGLHPSYNTYQCPNMIVAEAQRLRKVTAEEGIEQPQWGGRMHYLRWEHPTTLQGWADADMNYDSTLGYADRPGFRCGTCFEYQAFDPVKRKAFKLRIRPLVVMECSVTASRYLGLGFGADASKKIKHLKEMCLSVNGCFTLLWHNSELKGVKEKKLYSSTFE